MKKQLKYILLILTITSCSVTKNWQSNQKENSFSASYDEFNGIEKIELKEKKNELVYLSYLLKNTNGKLSIKVNRDNFSYTPNKIIHFKTSLNEPLIIQLKGEKAKGKFHLEYPTYKKKKIKVLYNLNFELLSLAYFLSNSYENIKDNNNTFDYDGKKVKVKDLFRLNLKIADRFKEYQKSENLNIINGFFKKHWYLDYTKFVMNLSDFPNAKYQEEKSNFKSLFQSKNEEIQFITALNNFYKEIRFDKYLSDYQPYYDEMISEIKNNLPDEDFISEMEHLYDKKAKGYFLNASLTMSFSQGFGIALDNEIGYVFGALEFPTEINDLDNLSLGYSNSLKLRSISIHEFGHSFVNPVVDQVADSIIDKKEFLYEPIKEEMSNQAYSSWKISLYEHFVRAGEIFLANQLGDKETAQELSKDYIKNRHFIYLNQIIPAMEDWYNNEYFSKSYADFVKETIQNLKLESIKTAGNNG